MGSRVRPLSVRVVATGIVAGMIVLATVVALVVLSNSPIWAALNLFSDAHRAENFRSMHEIFPAHGIAAGADTWSFTRNERPLPEHYRFDGEERSLAAFLEASETTGLLVARNGVILHEAYFQGNDERSLAASFSVAKSFVGAMVGAAIEQGVITSVHDPISDYVPELIGSGYEGVSIHDALTMSSGIRFDEDYDRRASDVMRLPIRVFVFRQSVPSILSGLQRQDDPGTVHNYVSSDALALGLLLIRTTGMTLANYLQETIWVPAGMESPAAWNTDHHGNELGYAFLSAALRDYGRFGRLYLNGGRRDAIEVLPSEWVQASSRPAGTHLQPGESLSSTPRFGYGYQWWIPDEPEGDFVAMGIWGQFIYVHPRYEIVIAKTSTDPGFAARERESIAVFRAIAHELGVRAAIGRTHPSD